VSEANGRLEKIEHLSAISVGSARAKYTFILSILSKLKPLFCPRKTHFKPVLEAKICTFSFDFNYLSWPDLMPLANSSSHFVK